MGTKISTCGLVSFEDVVREIMEDPVFKGNQNFKFEMDLDEASQRLFGGEANAGVAFQIGQLRYVLLGYKDVQCIHMFMNNIYHVYTCMYIVHTCTNR